MTSQDDALFPAPAEGMPALLLQLAELGGRVQMLEDLLAEDPAAAGYRPVPAPQWWLLEGAERDAAIARLEAWVDQVYRPSYGHLAARLPSCWAEHNLCLYVLDWLSELHTALYLPRRRSVNALLSQADWHTRHLVAAADLMADVARSCPHALPRMMGVAR